MNLASIDEINAFLNRAKRYKAAGKVDFINGAKEKHTLTQMGISIKDAFELIEHLTYRNYYRGPSPDHINAQEYVWEFGIEEEPNDIYIKLKIRQEKDDLLMMSFHYAERPITYPYKDICIIEEQEICFEEGGSNNG